jgi:hypothetical protein
MARPDGLIIEIGANDGTFLNILAQSGFPRRLGIEPSQALSALCERSGHAVVNLHLDEQSAHSLRASHGPAAAIICRHTLEHVPSPAALLRAMAVMLDEGGTLFLEVPDTDPVVGELRGFELWDEHLFYFSISNLRQILSACGFSVQSADVVSHRGSRNIVCWARRTLNGSDATLRQDAAALVRQCGEFGRRWSDFRRPLQEQSRHWRAPVIAMGASHPQSNFLHFSRIGNVVSGLLDEDPEKIGRWVALPQATPIFHPRELQQRLGNGTLLLSAFGYEAWTQRMRDQFRGSAISLVLPFDETLATASRNPSSSPVSARLARGGSGQ